MKIREASRLDAPELDPCWRVVLWALDRMGRSVGSGMAVDREDTRTEAFIKIQRSIHTLRAQDPAGAWAWVKQIYRNAHRDAVRRRRKRREVYDEDTVSERGSRGSYIERQAAPEPTLDPAKLDPSELAPYRDALFDRVDDYLATRMRSAGSRLNARRRTEIAYENIVRQRPSDELLAEAGGQVKHGTFYQWVRRGREEVLLPVLERWLAESSPDHAEHRYARTLTAVLESRQRADAGQPRPHRRKGDP